MRLHGVQPIYIVIIDGVNDFIVDSTTYVKP